MALITRIYENHPLSAYRTTIQQVVDEAIIEQVGKRAVVAASSKTAIRKKDLKGMGILPQLQVLTSRAVLSVAKRLASRLRDIKVRERQVAATNSLKAAAQRRIIKPEAKGRAVGSLVH